MPDERAGGADRDDDVDRLCARSPRANRATIGTIRNISSCRESMKLASGSPTTPRSRASALRRQRAAERTPARRGRRPSRIATIEPDNRRGSENSTLCAANSSNCTRPRHSAIRTNPIRFETATCACHRRALQQPARGVDHPVGADARQAPEIARRAHPLIARPAGQRARLDRDERQRAPAATAPSAPAASGQTGRRSARRTLPRCASGRCRRPRTAPRDPSARASPPAASRAAGTIRRAGRLRRRPAPIARPTTAAASERLRSPGPAPARPAASAAATSAKDSSASAGIRCRPACSTTSSRRAGTPSAASRAIDRRARAGVTGISMRSRAGSADRANAGSTAASRSH